MDPDTELGPLIDADHRQWVHRQVQDAVYGGAELHAGGEPLTRAGFFYPPTVIAGAPDDALVHCGETRGPVATIRVADSFDETAATPIRVGLASVLTPSQAHAQRAWRELPARTVASTPSSAAPARRPSPSCSTPSRAPKSSTGS